MASPLATPKLEEGGARTFRGVWSNLHSSSKEKDRPRERGNTSGSGGKPKNASSDDEADQEGDADRTLTRRTSGDGMAGDRAALAAAGFGASNLMGRRRNPKLRGESGDDQLPGSPMSPATVDSQFPQESEGKKRSGSQDQDDARVYQNDPFFGTGVMRARIPDPAHLDTAFTRHQPQTPGWESPWRPESRGGNSIEINGYRFGADGQLGRAYNSHGFFPRTDTKSSNGLKRRRLGGSARGASVGGINEKESGSRIVNFLTPRTGWKDYMLHNPFVPLLFRLLNLCITTSTLAVAIKIHLQLQDLGDTDAVGSSPLLAIIFSPMTIVHVAAQVYMEYFGRPIGLWDTGSKVSAPSKRHCVEALLI